MISYGQKGTVLSITADNVEGNENIYLTTKKLTGTYESVALQTLFTKVSAAAGGTAYIQGSVDGTTYVTLTSTANQFIFFPNDTVTITDGGYMYMISYGSPFTYYRFFIDGDANDTVTITPKYILK